MGFFGVLDSEVPIGWNVLGFDSELRNLTIFDGLGDTGSEGSQAVDVSPDVWTGIGERLEPGVQIVKTGFLIFSAFVMLWLLAGGHAGFQPFGFADSPTVSKARST